MKACPYQGLHFDIMSPKIAKKLGLKVEPINSRWEFIDALGKRVRITGTGLARISDRRSRGIVNRIAICEDLVEDMLLSNDSMMGISKEWEEIEEGEITEDTPVVARIRGDAPLMAKIRDEKPKVEKTDPKPKKPVKLNWDAGVVILVQLSKRKNIEEG